MGSFALAGPPHLRGPREPNSGVPRTPRAEIWPGKGRTSAMVRSGADQESFSEIVMVEGSQVPWGRLPLWGLHTL